MAFKSNDRTFEKVYGIFDKRDYFNAQGLAKVQIGNFERALQKNDKGAQQILDKFKGDMGKAKDYITQVITDRKKEQAFNDYKAFKAAVDSIQKGKPQYGAVDLVKSRIHNSSQKYTIALYSALRNKKFTKWKDVHNDVDDLIGESVNEGISVSDERHFGKKGIIIMIDDNGKKVSAIFKDKKNADKFNRNNPSDIKKLLQLAKKTKFPKAIDESSLSQIHKAAKKGSYPVTVLATMLGKVVKQELVTTPQAVPAVFKMMQGGYPKAKISVEDKTGKVLFMESKQDVIKLKKKSKSETAFYDILSTMEKKYGSRGFEKWLDKSLKDMGVNPRKFNTSAEKQEALYQSTLKEDLRNWFKSKWVNIGKKDKSGKHPPCGTSGKKRGYAKCVPAAKAATMSKKEKESATRRKRAAQNKSNRGGKSSAGQGKKPINVSTHTGGRKSGTGKGS